MANVQQLTLENVRISFPNFGGKVTDKNKNGSREYNVLLDPEVGFELAQQGWNVKKLPTEEEPNNCPYLPITLSNGPIVQPWIKIVLVNNGHGIIVQPDDAEQLALMDGVTTAARANVILSPYHWTVNGNSGIKAYTNKLYIYVDDIDDSLLPHMEDFEREISYL